MAKEVSILDVLKGSGLEQAREVIPALKLRPAGQSKSGAEAEDNFLLGKRSKRVSRKSIIDDIPELDSQEVENHAEQVGEGTPTPVKLPKQELGIKKNKIAPKKKLVPVQETELPDELKSEIDKRDQLRLQQVQPQKPSEVPEQIIANNIVIPLSMAELEQETLVNDITAAKDRKQKIEVITQKSEIPEDIEQYTEAVQQVTQAYQEITGREIEEPVDILEVRDELIEAVAEIPDATGVNLTNVELKVTKKDKDSKAGYFKVKVNIKKSGIPDIINKIASYVKSETKGLISPRVCDLRVIGNTNKTQLRGAAQKLSVNTVVFKPDFKKLKVNKGTRIMISIPDDFASTGDLLIYIQESRAKSIHKISKSDFETEGKFINFIAERIVEYYVVGYQATLARISLHATGNPLIEIMTKCLKSGQYRGKPLFDDNNMFGFDISTKSDLNQWLVVRCSESFVMPNKYEITAFNTVNGDEYELYGRALTYQELGQKCLNIIDVAFMKDWTEEITDVEDSEYNDFMYNLQKITHFKLRKAAIEIWDVNQRNAESVESNLPVIQVVKTLSKNDMEKLGVSDYDSEAILGKTIASDGPIEWVLTYLAYPIIGGDVRHGSDYITRQQYYQKYSVKDRNQYPLRKNTVIAKEGVSRNYNARIYLFQLEYKTLSRSHIYRAKTFKEILETGFLTGDLNFPETKY